MTEPPNRRILVIDDMPSIHQDFLKVLAPEKSASTSAVTRAKAAFLGAEAPNGGGTAAPQSFTYEISTANQGQQGLELVQAARKERRPFAVAFVDVRMPPGWDGIETVQHLWREDPELQAVICTAYSDYSWEQTVARLGVSDRWLLLKKPFDAIEIRQLATALTEKWNTSRRARTLIEELQAAETGSRTYASSLETVHRALLTAKASAEQTSQRKIDFVLGLGDRIHAQILHLLKPLASPNAFPALSTSEFECFRSILDASFDLTTTVDAAVDLTMLEAGRLKLVPESCAVGDLLRDAMRQLETRAKERGIFLSVEFRGEIPDRAMLDAARVKQIVVAMLGHAFATSTGTTVRVAIDLSMTDRWQCPWLRCEVVYRGPSPWDPSAGAPFEPFGRSPWALQLLLARQLALRMGGELVQGTAEEGEVSMCATVEAGDLSRARMVQV